MGVSTDNYSRISAIFFFADMLLPAVEMPLGSLFTFFQLANFNAIIIVVGVAGGCDEEDGRTPIQVSLGPNRAQKCRKCRVH